MSASIQVLYEDNHLLLVNKPSNLPTMGVKPGKPSLVDSAKQYIKDKYNKPGNVFLGVVSRLDGPVTGVVVFARTSKAASRLSKQFRNRTVDKTYWAVVSGRVNPASGECVDWLVKQLRPRKVLIADADTATAQEARLSYHVIKELNTQPVCSLLEVDLQTGRKHQIRVQLAHRKHPIVGDLKYGSKVEFSHGIALHARQLIIDHPVSCERMEFVAPVPVSWKSLGISDS